MMTIKQILLVTVATMGAVGCVGDLQPAPGGGSNPGSGSNPGGGDLTAEEMFNANVSPVMTSKCATCHTNGHPVGNQTGFVAASQAQAYTTIKGFVAVVGSYSADTAPILTKIAAGHNGISYTPGEISSITNWLDKELEEQNPGGGPTGSGGSGSGSGSAVETQAQTIHRVLNTWSGCMTKTDFDTANMAQGVGGWQTNNNQECDNCHATGAEGFIASRAVGGGDQTFFNVITQHSAYLQQYFVVDMSGGQAAAKIMMNRMSFDGVSQRKAPHVEHPTFDSSDNGQGIQAITQFYTLTQAHAGTPATCEAPMGRLMD